MKPGKSAGRLSPRIVPRLADAIDDADVHTYPGAGHAPHLTHPGDYLVTVAGYLSRLPERAAAAGVAVGTN
jgi:pimeloyl-ACP methyl ester carboxylesterase